MTRKAAEVVSGGWPDSTAFGDWVRPHLPAMTRVAAAFVTSDAVDDVVQEALLRAWKRSETFDPARGTPQAWLVGITANQAVRHRTRFRRLLVPHRSPDLM